MAETIIFAGHFNLGEIISDRQNQSMADAVTREGDLAILVGDIGFAENLETYRRGGVDAIALNHAKRRECSTSGCIRQQIPESIDLIRANIDSLQYEVAQEVLKFPAVRSKENDSTRVKGGVIPALIRMRLAEYGLSGIKVRVFSERVLRNLVSYRTSASRGKNESWRLLPEFSSAESHGGKECYLGVEEIVNQRGSPVCRGIMLVLYETLARQDYKRVVQLYPKEFQHSLEMAQNLYQVLQSHHPTDPRWQLKFENRFYVDST